MIALLLCAALDMLLFMYIRYGKALTSLAEKNKISAQRWKEADGAIKAEYNETAKNIQPKVIEKEKSNS